MVATVTLDQLLDGVVAQSPDTLAVPGSGRKRRRDYAHEDVVALATTASQRKFYGSQLAKYLKNEGRENELESKTNPGELEWHHNYIRFGELEDLAQEKRVGYQKLLGAIKTFLGNSRFIRFQLLFSHEHQLAFPRAFIDEVVADIKGQRKDRNKAPFLYDRPLVACLVSPDRIGDNFAIRLGLIPHKKGDKPFERYRRKAALSAINGLKLAFQSAVPISQDAGGVQRVNRVLVLQEPKPKDRDMFPGATVLDPSHHGSVLYIRELPNGTQNKKFKLLERQLMVQLFPSAYGARRKTRRESAIYIREVERLGSLKADLSDLNEILKIEWKSADSKRREEFCKQAKTLFNSTQRLLRHCENRYKIAAREKIEEVKVGKGELLDSRNRPNVAPFLAKVSSGKFRLEQRLEEISRKSGHNETDHILIRDAVARHERIIEKFGQNLVIELTSVRGAQRFERAFGERARVLAARDILGSSSASLDRIWLRPFTAFKKALGDNYTKLDEALRSKDRDAAEEALIKIHVVKKFFGVLKEFEKIKEDVLFPEDIRLDDMHTFISRLRAHFETYQIFPNRRVKGYVDPFEKLQKGLRDLERGINHYKVQEMTPAQRNKMFKSLKKFLEKFDIEDMVKNLGD